MDSELLGYAVGQSVLDEEIASFSSTKNVDLQSVDFARIKSLTQRSSHALDLVTQFAKVFSLRPPKRPVGVVLQNV